MTRGWIPALGAWAALTLSACVALGAGPAAAGQTVKIGFITSFSGQGASLGEQMDRAVKLYVKEHQAELGDVTLDIIRRDDTGPNPETAKRLAQELIARDRVDIITGLIYTPNAVAVAPLATEAKVPVVIMNAATSSILRLSPYMVRTSMTLWQQSYPLGQWAAKHGIKRAYTAVSDYAPGHDAEQAFAKGFTEAGGQIVGSVRMGLKTTDFVPFMQRIKDEKPDTLFLFVPSGKDATAAMKAFSELDMGKAGIKLIGTGDIVPDDELPNMSGVPDGILTMSYYSAAATRPRNLAFVKAWQRDYPGTVPNPIAVGAWDGMAAIFHAIKEQKGKLDPDRTMALLKGWHDEDSPRGPFTIDAETRHITQNMYVRELKMVDGKLANVEIETVPMVNDPWVQFNPEKK